MKLSIIVPVYNGEKTIEKCLESIFNSTYKNFEVIVVNDGSTDSTLEGVKKYNCRIIDLKKNQGAANARNVGVKHSKAEILVFVDSDVLIHKDALSRMVKAYKSDPGRIIGGIDSEKYLSDDFWRKFVTSKHCYDYNWKKDEKIKKFSCLSTSCSLVKKKIFNEVGGFNTKYKRAGGEEFEIACKFLEKGHACYVYRDILFDHYQEDAKKRIIELLRRAIVHLPILLKKKSFESEGATGTVSEALMCFFSFLGVITSFLVIISTKLILIPISFFTIVIIANSKFFFYLTKKQGFIFSLTSIFFLIITHLAISLGIILGVIKLFLNKEEY